MSTDEIIWLVILVPGTIRSAGLLFHSWDLARDLAHVEGLDPPISTYARGAAAQEIVRFVAFLALLGAIPTAHLLPGRAVVFALFVAAAALTINTFLAGRLTARLEAEEESSPDGTAETRRRRFRVFERRRKIAFKESETAERDAFDAGEDRIAHDEREESST